MKNINTTSLLKKHLICFCFLVPTIALYGQEIRFGLSGSVPADAFIEDGLKFVSNTEYTYQSTKYNIVNIDGGYSFASLPVAPGMYVKYQSKNSLFLESGLEFNILNTYYSLTSDTIGDYDDGGFIIEDDSIRFPFIEPQFYFISNSYRCGLQIFKNKKLITPYLKLFLSGGITLKYLLNSSKQTNYSLFEEDNSPYLNTTRYDRPYNKFNTVTFYYELGFGFKILNFSGSINYGHSLGNIDNSDTPVYKSLQYIFFRAEFDLFTKYIKAGKDKKAVHDMIY